MRLITSAQVDLGLDVAERRAAIVTLTQLLADEGRVTDTEAFLTDVVRREEQLATGLPGGIAIPHARSRHVTEPAVAFGRAGHGIDWGAADGPATLVFLIAVPHGAATDHLAILAKLARRLTHQDFKQQLNTLEDPEAVADLIQDALLRS